MNDNDSNSTRVFDDAALGKPEALRALLEEFGPQVGRAIQSQIGARLNSLIDSDDVMQITYMETFLQISTLTARDPAGFVAWIRRIAENNLRDAIRELERKKRPNPSKRVNTDDRDDAAFSLVELLGAGSMTPSRDAARAEAGTILHTMLERLPSDYRTVIEMVDLGGHSIEEVADALKRSPGAVHMLRARAHDRLRQSLGTETQFFTKKG